MEPVLPPTLPFQNAADAITATAVMNDQTHPVTWIWVFKAPIIMILISVITFLFGYFIPYFIIAIPILLIANPLQKKSFHYFLDDKFFYVKQGVISKKERQLPYGVIQNVIVKQDLFDRLLGIASLRIENAVPNGSKPKKFLGLTISNRKTGTQDFMGSSGGTVSIPGLKKADAEDFKSAVLQKMQQHPIDPRLGL